jgi:hypothetical protein
MNTSTYIEITTDSGMKYIQRTDADGKVWAIPMDEANADYQAYLNKDTLPSNSSTPQAGAN